MENKNMIFRKITYPVVESNRYMISNDGKIIYDTLKNKTINIRTDKDGYFYTSLSGKNCRINRLVAWDFCLKNRDISLVVDHIDGNKQNNNYTNLEWVTVKENTRRAEEMGLRNVKGESNGNNTYSEELIHMICQLFVEGKGNMDIYRIIVDNSKVDVRDNKKVDMALYQLIYKLRNRHIWHHVTKLYDYSPETASRKIFKPIDGKSRFNESQVHKICRMHVNGKSSEYILKSLKIYKNNADYIKYRNSLNEILSGRTWRYITENYFESRVGKGGRIRHEIDEIKLSEMLDNRMPIEYIYFEFGVYDKPSRDLTKRAILKRIMNYCRINNIKKYKDISIPVEEIHNLETWAAEW